MISCNINTEHEIPNNVVCAASKGSDQPAHTHSLIRAFASLFNIFMTLRLLTEPHLEFLSLKGGHTGSCQNATLLESHVVVHFMNGSSESNFLILTTQFSCEMC